MSRLRITTLALSLGLLVVAWSGDHATTASADEGAWGTARSSFAAPAAAAQLGRPVVGVSSQPAVPALLERPRAQGDGQVRTVDYAPVIRGQMGDAKPLPAGPAADGDAGLMPRNWQRPSPDQTIVSAPPAPAPEVDGGAGDCGGTCCGHRPLRSLCSWFGSVFGCDDCPGDYGYGDRSCGEDGACGGVDGACGEGHGVFGCGGCCPPASRFYASAEYLLWWTKGQNLPPLVTAGSAGDLAAGA